MSAHRPHRALLAWLLPVLIFCPWGLTQAGLATTPLVVPQPLEPWVPWVLEGHDPRPCPLDPTLASTALKGGDGTADTSAVRLCAWPGRLRLDLDTWGGFFTQGWRVYAQSWVPLPGDPELWPQEVSGRDGPLAVVLRDGRPSVRLPPGEQSVSGRFDWTTAPEGLALPPEIGLIDLVWKRAEVAAPRRDRDGRLWLAGSWEGGAGEEGDRLGLRVYRKIVDELPLRLTARLELEVAGRARLLALGPVPLAGGIPLAVRSPIPARLDADGRLQLQVRPGTWVVEVETQHPGLVEALSRVPTEPPWPEFEVWSFAAHPQLRQVELSGAPSVDPTQSGLPTAWSRLPAYRLGPDDTLSFEVRHRGDPDPGPDRLSLERDLWLDFDGGGYSARDRLTGTLTRSWRLALAPPLTLGQARVDGGPQLITQGVAGAPPGIEVRAAQLQLTADSRLQGQIGRIPASGWQLGLDAVRLRLHLPAGWDLLAVSGVDNLPRSWLARWTLLDLFLVLILTLGVARLWGWRWGLLGLAALALTWQAPGAPHLIWLNLMAGAALLRFLPGDSESTALRRLRGLVRWYLRLALLALLVVGLPFLLTQVRGGIWPQLEPPLGKGYLGGWPPVSLQEAPPPVPSAAPQDRDEAGQRLKGAAVAGIIGGPGLSRPPVREVIDPGAQVQTGPGIPDWDWGTFDLTWSGPVPPAETARLWLLSPPWHCIWSLTGALFLVLLGLRMAGLIGHPRGPSLWGRGAGEGGETPSRSGGSPGLLDPAPRAMAWLLLPGLLAVLWAPLDGAHAETLPTPELLSDLKARLLELPDCLPGCLELTRLELIADTQTLRLELRLDAAVRVAAPVLAGAGGWLPETLTLDGEPLDGLRRDAQGRLLAPLMPGRHLLVLEGPLPNRAQVEIPLPLAPRFTRADLTGWTLEGLDPSGRAGTQLRLVRLASPQSGEQPLVQEALPPLLLVERNLHLGIDWRLETRVRRLSPPEGPVLVPVPLLPGESVQSPGVQVRDGAALASLAPGVLDMGWSSTLEPQERLSLQAISDSRLTESWTLDVSPRWHLDWSGIPPVGQVASPERWRPSWRPLPGESLDLLITRPEAVPGATLTIDRVDLAVRPGRRASASELRLALRSTLGGVHPIRLPPGAEPVRLLVDGQERPLPPAGADLELRLVPGNQSVQAEWREPHPIGTRFSPEGPHLGAQAVNLNLSLSLPPERWVIFASGPTLGPVVLFWPLLLVLLGLSLALGRSRLTPLRVHDWLLLGVGLSLAQIWITLLVVGWLFALALRQRMTETTPPWRYNLTQVGLVLLSLAALTGLVGAVSQGLLGTPDMQISGNGSSAWQLNWYQDRGGPDLPRVSVLSVPIWVYRALMLAWALWLALRLLAWLRWGWDGLSRPVLWRESPPRPRRRWTRPRETPRAT